VQLLPQPHEPLEEHPQSGIMMKGFLFWKDMLFVWGMGIDVGTALRG
jgi:hypothetical protein